MTREDFIDFIERIKGFYPTFKEAPNTALTWYGLLSDVPFPDALDALNLYARENKFAPTISGILGHLPRRKPLFVQDPEKEPPRKMPDPPNSKRVYSEDKYGRKVFWFENIHGTGKRAKAFEEEQAKKSYENRLLTCSNPEVVQALKEGDWDAPSGELP